MDKSLGTVMAESIRNQCDKKKLAEENRLLLSALENLMHPDIPGPIALMLVALNADMDSKNFQEFRSGMERLRLAQAAASSLLEKYQ